MHTHTICFPAADPVRYLDEIASSFCDGNGGEEHGDGYLFDCNSLLVEPGSYQEISRDLYINLAGIITGLYENEPHLVGFFFARRFAVVLLMPER